MLFLDVDGVLHPAMCGIQLQKALGTEAIFRSHAMHRTLGCAEDSTAMVKLAKAENGLFRPRAMRLGHLKPEISRNIKKSHGKSLPLAVVP